MKILIEIYLIQQTTRSLMFKLIDLIVFFILNLMPATSSEKVGTGVCLLLRHHVFFKAMCPPQRFISHCDPQVSVGL